MKNGLPVYNKIYVYTTYIIDSFSYISAKAWRYNVNMRILQTLNKKVRITCECNRGLCFSENIHTRRFKNIEPCEIRHKST